MLTENIIQELINARVELYHTSDYFKNLGMDKVYSTIKEDIESLVELTDPAVCQERYDDFKLEGVTPEDFCERVIPIDEKLYILAGIRFHTMNINHPFISIYINTSSLTNDLIKQISIIVKKEFEVFKPLFFQLTIPGDINLPQANYQIDTYRIAGKIDDIIKMELIQNPQELQLVPLETMDFYEQYVHEYNLFHSKFPQLKKTVKVESLKSLNYAAKKNLLFKFLVDGTTAGLIAGIEDDYWGQSGVHVLDELLFDQFKGKGFGVYIQKEFTKLLKGRYEVLWGTINNANIPSQKTALKNGREIVELDVNFLL